MLNTKSIIIAFLSFTISANAYALFGHHKCKTKSPIIGLEVDDLASDAFSVEWKKNWGREIPLQIKVTLDGKDATPDIPWFLLIKDKGAGFTEADDGIQPGTTYRVEVSQMSRCKRWSTKTIHVTTPGSLEESPTPEILSDVNANQEQYEEEYSSDFADAAGIEPTNQECLPGDMYSGCGASMDMDSLMNEEMGGSTTAVTSGDGSQITVYEEITTGQGEVILVEVPSTYDPVTGTTTYQGASDNYVYYSNDEPVDVYNVVTTVEEEGDQEGVCDITLGPCD
jgi:hypothetical protein